MRTKHVLLSLAAGLMFSVASADAALYLFNVSMDGLEEVPPVPTPATGSATVLFNDVSGAMSVSGSFSSLIGAYTASHVHGYAPAGTNAPVIIPLILTTGGPTSGTIGGAGVIPAISIPDVLAGLTYINVHSQFRPGGEIRGQIADGRVIPEPASVAVWAFGVAGLFAVRRIFRTV